SGIARNPFSFARLDPLDDLGRRPPPPRAPPARRRLLRGRLGLGLLAVGERHGLRGLGVVEGLALVVEQQVVDDLVVVQSLARGGDRLDGGADRLERRLLADLAAPAPAPRARAALGEVAQQVARQGARLAGQARPRPAQDLLGLGRVAARRRQQRRLQAPILLARRVDQAPRVAGV